MAARREVEDSETVSEREPSARGELWFAELLEQAGSLALRMQVMPAVRVIEVVGALESLTGMGPAELRDNPSLWWRLVHPEDRSRLSSPPSTAQAMGPRGRGNGCPVDTPG